MRIHFIACSVFLRELSFYASTSPHISDLTFIPQGLHDTPKILNDTLAREIARVEALKKNRPDAIVLLYGLCSNGVVGLGAQTIPLVIHRTDDCIAVFLGSQKRYLELFERYNPVYWLNNGWIERAYTPTWENRRERYEEYLRDFDEDNAEYLIEQDDLWIKNYRYGAFISSGAYESPAYRETARHMAGQNGWDFAEVEGDNAMLERLVCGRWDGGEFLVCAPGEKIAASYDDRRLIAVSADSTT